MKKISFTKYIMAILLVGAGILLLLVNLNVISLEINNFFVYIIPVLLVFLGLKWLFDAITSRGYQGSVFMGLISLIYGVLLLAGLFNYIDFKYGDILKLWPLLLVYFGFKIFGGSKYKHKHKHKNKKKMKIEINTDDDDDEMYGKFNNMTHGRESGVFNIVGEGNFTEPNWYVEPMEIRKAILDYDFDFTNAFIPDKETPIEMSGWVGDIKIRVPEDLEFMVEGKAKIGDIKIGSYKGEGLGKDLYYKTPGYDEATRKIKFIIYFKVLDFRIDQV